MYIIMYMQPQEFIL